MSDVLDRILAYKRDEVRARKTERPIAALEADARSAPPPRRFAAALHAAAEASGRPALIAEIKKASPSKGLIRVDFEPADLARAYAEGGAACLSVLTDAPSFQGHESYLGAARSACLLPVLRKDFMIDPWQVAESRAIGADAVLIILAACDDTLAAELHAAAHAYGMDALVECHDEVEMERAARLGALLVGVNNRSLRTFETRLDTTDRLARLAAPEALLVSESGIFTPADVTRVRAAGARAVLVGEALMRATDVTGATRALLN